MEKICANCKWIVPQDAGFNCLNPINDQLYDHFNPSSGDIVRDLRRASVTFEKNTCDEFVQKKKVSSSK
jgi:hypothetical protein